MHFYKYQATGNDFIIIDNRDLYFDKGNSLRIKDLCNRRFGIGADGLILLESDPDYAFKMVYFNADGHLGSMCGNGGRCISSFAFVLLGLGKQFHFQAFDGIHRSEILSENANQFTVRLSMGDVKNPETYGTDQILHTGSPHYVQFVNNIKSVDVFGNGRKIRQSADFAKEGINVNFVELIDGETIYVRTYERGVEDETLSCGTGVTAAALSASSKGITGNSLLFVNTLGGTLKVGFKKEAHLFTDVFLEGEAVKVFEGDV
jgi:diaminopimelate epimerase